MPPESVLKSKLIDATSSIETTPVSKFVDAISTVATLAVSSTSTLNCKFIPPPLLPATFTVKES